jgi:hypothetical protein
MNAKMHKHPTPIYLIFNDGVAWQKQGKFTTYRKSDAGGEEEMACLLDLCRHFLPNFYPRLVARP